MNRGSHAIYDTHYDIVLASMRPRFMNRGSEKGWQGQQAMRTLLQ